jgi:hypothetical protein
MHRTIRGSVLVALLLASSLGLAASKKPAVTQPKPDNGPSLAATMQFIQDTMNNQGVVGFVYTRTEQKNSIYRDYYRISDVVADASACSLRTTETTDVNAEAINGTSYKDKDGNPLSAEDLHSQHVGISTLSFRDVAKLTVESGEEYANRGFAQSAHPEITGTFAPMIFYLTLTASKPLFSFHNTDTSGKQSPVVKDLPGSTDYYKFRDEETANRVAKAMTHAVELCGGGNNDPF